MLLSCIPTYSSTKGDGIIDSAIFLLILTLFGQGPVSGLPARGTFTELSAMPSGSRSGELTLLNESYCALEGNSGPCSGTLSNEDLQVGSIVEISVWRPLTPIDLALLDRCGFWPVGRALQKDAFAAAVTSPPDIADLSSGGFVRTLEPWNASEYSESLRPADWTGHFLLVTATDSLPQGGRRVAADMVRVPGSPEDFGYYCGFPGVLKVIWETGAHPVNAQFRADDSRRLISCPSIWDYYDGEGTITGVLDTGVWSSHPDLSSAVISGPPDQDGHGTAVCGVISSIGSISLDCQYDGRGVAYGGSLYALERPSSLTAAQLDSIFGEFGSAGCQLVNNSWGYASTGYDDLCEIVDYWVDTQDLILVYSAGNLGASGGITSPGNAKNCITVGAVTYVPDASGNCYLAPYSGQGPTTGDGRLKPDILAPGGAFTDSTMEYGVATTNARYGGVWLDDPLDRWPDEPYYTRRAGTSMAAAHVSGVLALCFQKYGELLHPEDILALTAASAIPLKGNTGPASSGYATTGYGYGLVDSYHLPGVYFSEEVDRPLWIHETYIEGTIDREWIFYIPSNVKWLSGAMAYSDVPGPGICNDLDLTLESPGGTSYSFTLPSGVTGESPLERICVEDPEPGAWTARITARSWSDPGNPFEEEDYTAVVYSYSREPALSLSSPSDTTIYAAPESQLDLALRVRNSGGYIIAGTWSSIEAPSGFSGDVFDPRYMGNLVYIDAVKTDTFTISTPATPGTYDLTARANGANLGLQPDSSVFQVVIAYPDLSVSVPGPDESPPFYVGQSVMFSTVVTNLGEGPAESCQLSLFLEEDPDSSTNTVATYQVPALQGGETRSYNTTVTFSYFDLGERYLAAEVDVEDSVNESSEDNNRAVFGPFDVQGILAPPENLVAESGFDGYVPLSWNSPDPDTSLRDSKGLAGYNIYRGLSPLGPPDEPLVSLSSSDTTYTDSLVSNGVTYYYWATTIYSNPYGESDYSNMARATPQGPSGSLSGYISDLHTGQVLRDVSVSIQELSLESMTDADGFYSFGNLPVGPVPVIVQKTGYETVHDTVTIIEDQNTQMDFLLQRVLSQGLNVIPNPFTPNGDGINDQACFIWPGVEGEIITVDLYSLQGVPLRTLEGYEPFWEGKDDNGTVVPAGMYVYMAWAGDRRSSGVICVAR